MHLLQLLFNLSHYSWCRSALHSRRWRKRRLTDFLLSNFCSATREFLFKSLKDNFMLLVIHVMYSIGRLAKARRRTAKRRSSESWFLSWNRSLLRRLCWVGRVYVQRWWLPNENTCRLRHVVFETEFIFKSRTHNKGERKSHLRLPNITDDRIQLIWQIVQICV